MKVKRTVWILSLLFWGMAWSASTPTALANDPAGSSGCVDDTWAAISTEGAPARAGRTAVWTGSEMLVWGGSYCDSERCYYLNTGGRYDPATDTWTAITTDGAPSPRIAYRAVWTGTEMIVWGGVDNNLADLNTGGRYDPATDTWTAITTDGAPSPRSDPTAVWTGTEMIVWGGFGGTGRCPPFGFCKTGGRYNPATDTWTATSTVDAPSAQAYPTAVWTGDELIVWGGGDSVNTGGRYNPTTNTWVATSTDGAPSARYSHTAVWTGSTMIVWGGYSVNTRWLKTGGQYDPATDTWAATRLDGAPSVRAGHTAVWTGTEMIVWGGIGSSLPKSGGRYDPATDIWVAMSTDGAPSPRGAHTAVWTGSEMIVWGGTTDSTGGRYCAR